MRNVGMRRLERVLERGTASTIRKRQRELPMGRLRQREIDENQSRVHHKRETCRRHVLDGRFGRLHGKTLLSRPLPTHPSREIGARERPKHDAAHQNLLVLPEQRVQVGEKGQQEAKATIGRRSVHGERRRRLGRSDRLHKVLCVSIDEHVVGREETRGLLYR